MKKYYYFIQQAAYLGFFIVGVFAVSTFRNAIPDQMYVAIGQTVNYDFQVPVSVVLKDESTEVFENMSSIMDGEKDVSYTVTCKLFGIFPVKDVEVMLVDSEAVYASGMPIGIYVKTEGVLIIGTGSVTDEKGNETKPAENVVKGGDYIVSVNGQEVSEKEELIQKIEEYGEEKEILGIVRNDEYIEVSVSPAMNEDGDYMLGIWVRDDLAGVGTLTYYRSGGEFGALGHAVSDGDTGSLMKMSEGWVYATNIIGIKKGENGKPGELSGVIDYSKECCLGTITKNSPLGIRGTLDGNLEKLDISTSYDVTYKQDIKLGKAYIISSVSGESKKYEIEIKNLDYSGQEENKGILFQVTDPELLKMTGGIVQGMSGSPIIQDDKIIGAVTHVFVSDASMGYGIFIEKMLN